jgi:branched-chain amino acid aminotransferase
VNTETAQNPGKPSAAGDTLKVWLNGRLLPKAEAVISVFDHGLLYGDGIFEGIRIYAGRVFKLKEHLDRLYRSARAICLEVGLTPAELEKAVLETARANGVRDGYVRLVVTRGTGDLGLDPRKCPKATTFVIADKITLYPEECYTKGMEVATVPTRRVSPQALNPNIKSLNYLNNVLAKIEANQIGVREAVMLNNEGYVAECTGDNVFYVREGQLVTPPTAAGALEGITRNTVMALAAKMGLSVAEKFFTPYDLYTAEEAFLTGTAAEIVPVVRMDTRPVGAGVPGPWTLKLITAYRELTRAEGTPL